jgi:hypothetical protein
VSKGTPIRYSAKELAFIKRRRGLPRRELHAAFLKRFRRTHPVSFANIKQLCTRKGWLTGRDGYFVKGQKPYNAGKKRPSTGNMWKTQFKNGQLPHNTKWLGHERLSKEGYIEISVRRRNPHTGFYRRYVLKHRWLWEKKHGPVPAGMVLKCKGDRLNTDPSNWELLPRAILPRLNGRFGRDYDSAPADLKPTIMAVAKLEHGLREKRKGAR